MIRRLLINLILTAGLLLSVSAGVKAQSSTTLLVLPANSEVFLNNTKSINLAVFDGVEVNAFDVTVTYDPQVLTLESWEYGFYLSGLAQVYKKDEPGEFRLAATQLAKPGVSGDGILLTLVFRGSGEGVSNITISSAEFSNPIGVSTLPVREHGKLTVYGPTKTPTATPTKTPTASTTVTRTATATRTPTASTPIAATGTSEGGSTASKTATGTRSLAPTSSATRREAEAVLESTQLAAATETAEMGSTYPAGGTVVPPQPTNVLVPAGDAAGGDNGVSIERAVRILDWILGGVIVLAVVFAALIMALLVKWKSRRNT